MADYWKNRLFEAQKKWTDKDIDVINKILRHYYKIARENIVEDFEAVYDKVLAQAEEGKPITPADLYKLDKYYKMQAQLQDTLQINPGGLNENYFRKSRQWQDKGATSLKCRKECTNPL